jgi:phenylacetate-CoA ligase
MLGTPSCILQLAKEVRAHRQPVNGLHLSTIFTGGELLDTPTRSYMKATFNAKVYDSYGAAEIGTIGHECPNEQLHVDTHSTFLEITNDGNPVAPGEVGEITVTNLYNYAQPAIRYNLKDIGHLITDPCPCGKHSPVLEITHGRKMEVIQRLNMNPIPVNEVCAPLTFLDGIRQFQILQETIDTITVKIVPGPSFTDAGYNETRRLVQQCIGDTMTLNLVIVDSIPREQSGKLHRFKTHLR